MARFKLLRPRLLGVYLVMFALAPDVAGSQTVPPVTAFSEAMRADERPAGPRPAPVALTGDAARRDSTQRSATSVHVAPAPVSAPVPRSENRADLALMAVGGAALLIGVLVGDDAGTVIAIGGGVIGLVGLYRFVR